MIFLNFSNISFALVFLFLSFFSKFEAHAGFNWEASYLVALDHAKAEKKLILIDFTGSDWCGWCVKLDKEILSTQEFQNYADKNLILLKVDFPKKASLTPNLAKQNNDLKAQYQIKGFPTLVVLNSNAQEVDRIVGFGPIKNGTQALISRLNKFKSNSPNSSKTKHY
jgi:thiol-disulfide isomerase/thioredoxin